MIYQSPQQIKFSKLFPNLRGHFVVSFAQEFRKEGRSGLIRFFITKQKSRALAESKAKDYHRGLCKEQKVPVKDITYKVTPLKEFLVSKRYQGWIWFD